MKDNTLELRAYFQSFGDKVECYCVKRSGEAERTAFLLKEESKSGQSRGTSLQNVCGRELEAEGTTSLAVSATNALVRQPCSFGSCRSCSKFMELFYGVVSR